MPFGFDDALPPSLPGILPVDLLEGASTTQVAPPVPVIDDRVVPVAPVEFPYEPTDRVPVPPVPVVDLPRDVVRAGEAAKIESELEQLTSPQESEPFVADVDSGSAPVSAQVGEEIARIGSDLADREARIFAATQQRAQLAREERAEESAVEQAQIVEAGEEVSRRRQELQGLMKKGKPPLSSGEKLSVIFNALSTLFGGDPGASSSRIQEMLARRSREWASRLTQEERGISLAEDELSGAEQEWRANEQSARLAEAAMYDDLAKETTRLGLQSRSEQERLRYTAAADMFREQAESANIAAQDALIDRKIKIGKFALEEERVRQSGAKLGLDRQRLLAALRKDAEQPGKEAEADTLVDPVTRQPIFRSRFKDRKEILKAQQMIGDYTTSQRRAQDYIALLEKVNRLYKGPLAEKQRSDLQKQVIAAHGRLISSTIKELSGTAASDAEVARIEKFLPGPKNLGDIGSWDVNKFARRYFIDAADRFDDQLSGYAPVDMGPEEFRRRSPTARFRAVQAARSSEQRTEKTDRDRIQALTLDQRPQRSYRAATALLTQLRRGDFSQEEAEDVVESFLDTSDAFGDSDAGRAFDLLAARAQDYIERVQLSDKSGKLNRYLDQAEGVKEKPKKRTARERWEKRKSGAR